VVEEETQEEEGEKVKGGRQHLRAGVALVDPPTYTQTAYQFQ